MTGIRKRIDEWFGALARIVFRHRLKTLLLMGVWIFLLVSQLPKLTIDTSNEGLLHENAPVLVNYNDFREQFGRDELIVVAIKPPEIFELTFLERLKALHEELEANVPYLDDITSLINVSNTRGEANELIVEDLMEEWPQTEEAIQTIKERVFATPAYMNTIISEDGDFTTISLKPQTYVSAFSAKEEFDVMGGFDDGDEAEESAVPTSDEVRYLSDEESNAVVEAVQRIVQKYQAEDFQIWLAGNPVIVQELQMAMLTDMGRFVSLALLIIAVSLFVMFRSVTGVAISLAVVALSELSALALMAATGTPIKSATQILPSFLLAVSVGASVHILALFFHRLRQYGDKERAVVSAVRHSGLAVVMTSLTTAAGLFSFVTADVAPVAELGIFGGIGVLFSLLYSVVLIPALLAVLPVNIQKIHVSKDRHTLIDRLMGFSSRISTTYPKAIATLTIIGLVLFIAGAARIRFSHNPLEWLPEDHHVRQASETIDREMRGSMALELIVDSEQENGMYNPDLLNRLEHSARFLEEYDEGPLFVGKVSSLSTTLKEIHRALNENRQEYYAIPQNRELIAQEFLLFENSGADDLEDITDSQFSKARLTIKVPFTDSVAYKPLFQLVEEHVQQLYPDARVTLTGMMALLNQTVLSLFSSMVESYAIALAVISLLMILLLGRLRIGLMSMIPNLFPILLTLGVMGWFGMPMDLFTMMVASIAIGLAVDNTIHFMHNFRRYYEDSGDPQQAVWETLHSSGRAMFVTSCVLSLAFFVFMFASMKSLFNFGLLTGITVITAMLADFFISPALMVLVSPAKEPESQASSQSVGDVEYVN